MRDTDYPPQTTLTLRCHCTRCGKVHEAIESVGSAGMRPGTPPVPFWLVSFSPPGEENVRSIRLYLCGDCVLVVGGEWLADRLKPPKKDPAR